MSFGLSPLSWLRSGPGVVPTPPTPPVVVIPPTQTFAGFGGGFLGPYYKRKREELYAKAEFFKAPGSYRFSKRELLPKLVFPDTFDDPLLELAAEGEPQNRSIVWMKLTPELAFQMSPEGEKQRKMRKRQREEDEVMLSILTQ